MVSATFSSNPGLSRSYTSKEKTSATPGCRQCFLFSLSLRAIHSSVQWVQPSAPGGSEAVENRFWAQAVILCSESNQKKILPCDFNLKIKVSASLKFCYLLQSWRQCNKINSLRIQPDALQLAWVIIHRRCKTLSSLQRQLVVKSATYSTCTCHLCASFIIDEGFYLIWAQQLREKEALAKAEQSLFKMDIPVFTLRHETWLQNVWAADYGCRQIMEENENHICPDN